MPDVNYANITDIDSTIEVDNPYTELNKDFNGSVELLADGTSKSFLAKIDVDLLFGELDLNGSVSIDKEYSQIDLPSNIKLEIADLQKDIKTYIKIDKILVDIDLLSKIEVPRFNLNSDISGTTKIEKDTYSSEFDGKISIAYRYANLDTNCIYGCVTLEDNKTFAQFEGNVKLANSYIWRECIFGDVTLPKEDVDIDIESSIDVTLATSTTDIQGTVNFPKRNCTKFIPCSLLVPKFITRYTIPSSIKVSKSNSYTINCKLIVPNTLAEINCILNIDKIDYSRDIIEGSITIPLSSHEDITGLVHLSMTNIIRDLNGTVNLMGNNITDIESKINVKPPIIPIGRISKEIYCSLITGYNDQISIDSTITIPEYISTDFISTINVLPSPMNIPTKRIGIIVDPYWPYEVYTFKSSLITLLDRYYRKEKLEIIYGTNGRSNWDISHLGRVFDTKLHKVHFIYDIHNQKENRLMLENLTNELFSKPIDRVFFFMERSHFNKSNPIFNLSLKCLNNDISSVIISGSGDYLELKKDKPLFEDKIRITNDPIV